jgi:hypothetical protein
MTRPIVDTPKSLNADSPNHRVVAILPRPRALAALIVLAALSGGCGETDKKRWDDFWGGNDSSGVSLLGRRAGDTELWTIECNEYRGSGCKPMADTMATALKKVRELGGREIWVEHEGECSRVFCGEYKLKYGTPKSSGPRRSQAPAEPQIQFNDDIRRDLELIRGLAIGDTYPFFSARAIPKPLPDVGPPEWDLRNANGVYTLNVGVTYNTPTMHNYKEAAVEWVKDLRKRGYPAYYYHDPTKPRSSICVGTFGEDAFVVGHDGRKRCSDAVLELREKEELRWNLENGTRTYRAATGPDGSHARMANESFLVKIPKG